MATNKNSKRVTPQWKRNAINSAIAVAFSGMVAAPAWSACPSSITGAQVSCSATSSAQVINITSTGVVSTGVANSSTTGIYYGGGLLSPGSLTNSGTISATANGYSVYAYGIYVQGNLTGSLTNSGSINVSANGTSDAEAYGIYVGGSLSGTLTNSGTINVTATSLTSDAYAATGIYINGSLSLGGVLNNTGTISATAIANSYASDARGIYVEGDLAGTLTNSGTIRATAISTSGWYATAYGVYVDDNLTGTLTNSGTISATATNTSRYATAYGIYVGGNLTTLTNSGTISATANGYSWASAQGVYVSGTLSGLLRNTSTGTISARATSDNSSASATGVYIGTIGATGILTNDGSISAVAVADDWAGAYGVVTYNLNAGGKLTNNGTISASATSMGNGSNPYASAYGVAVWSTLAGTLTNAGTITASASGRTWASAYGVYAGTVGATGVVTNTGTISATARAVDLTSRAAGFQSWNMNGTLTNSGTISGTANLPENGYSLYVDGGSGTINNQAGGLLSGNIYVNGPTVNNAGTIAIPAGAGGYINGNYTQQTGGVLQIGATDELTYGQLYVGGTANLTASNTIAVRATIGNTLAAGDVLNDVLGSNTLTGLVPTNTVNVIGTPLYTYIGLVDAGGEIDVTIASVNTITGVLGSLGNASLTGIGATLDGLLVGYTGTEPLDPLLDAIYATNSKAELANLVSQFVPITSTTQATANMLRGTSRIIQARQDGNLGLSSGDRFYGDRAVWLKPFGSFADQGDRNGVSGYEAKTYGMAFGADTELSKTARVGAAFVYARSDVDGNSSIARQNADIDSYQAILYGSYSLDDRTELNLQADFGVHGNDSKRSIPAFGLTASGSFISLSSHLGVGVGRTYTLSPKSSFTPSVRADYTQIRNRGYTETGAGVYNLNVGSNTTDELILAVDGRYTYAVSGGTTFVVNLGAGYDALSEAASVTSTFVGGGAAFASQGIDPSPWLVRGGLGMVMKAVNNMPEVNARYDIEGRQDYTNQTASVKLRWSF